MSPRFILTARTNETLISRNNARNALTAQRHALVRKDIAARRAAIVTRVASVITFVAVFSAAVYFFA